MCTTNLRKKSDIFFFERTKVKNESWGISICRILYKVLSCGLACLISNYLCYHICLTIRLNSFYQWHHLHSRLSFRVIECRWNRSHECWTTDRSSFEFIFISNIHQTKCSIRTPCDLLKIPSNLLINHIHNHMHAIAWRMSAMWMYGRQMVSILNWEEHRRAPPTP